MINRNTTLLTDSLNYDRLYDLGYYFEGGTLMDEENVLTSDWGEYSPATKVVGVQPRREVGQPEVYPYLGHVEV